MIKILPLILIAAMTIGNIFLPGLIAWVGLMKASTAFWFTITLISPVCFLVKEKVGIQMLLDLNRFAKNASEVEIPDTKEMEDKIKEIIVTISFIIAVVLI